jgi:hypothetical protein
MLCDDVDNNNWKIGEHAERQREREESEKLCEGWKENFHFLSRLTSTISIEKL